MHIQHVDTENVTCKHNMHTNVQSESYMCICACTFVYVYVHACSHIVHVQVQGSTSRPEGCLQPREFVVH